MPARFRSCLALVLIAALPARADSVWVEGERPERAAVTRHPSWYDQVKRAELSGGDFITNWGESPGVMSYRVLITGSENREFWVRANPTPAQLSYRLNGGDWKAIDLEKGLQDRLNIAADDKVDLRFLAWVNVGRVSLKQGANTVEFRMDSANHNHGAIDCFVLADEPFTPRGTAKPGEAHSRTPKTEAENPGWFVFDPPSVPRASIAGFDLRTLNESMAGDGGFIGVNGDNFIHSKTKVPVRFWAVNGPASKHYDDLRREARMLAKYGVNLVRVHHGYFDGKTGALKSEEIAHAQDIVEAMKHEGIYTHFSIYFPLWLSPGPDNPVLQGYDGQKKPFAALFFDDDFQAQYREWWKALLTTPSARTGKRLIDEPAVFGAEILNEDSYFFWTFTDRNLPDPELRILESRFGDWLKHKHGFLEQALAAWEGVRLPRDRPDEGRIAFRPPWNIANERKARDKDTARFLLESQRGFYEATYKNLRTLGFRGLITASNWTTASQAILGPLEKYSYTSTDFIDRHGYFSCLAKGENSDWSIRNGHTYADRSALRFDPEQPGKPKEFAHPASDPQYGSKPSMISETTFNRPNRYRSEAPLFYAAYGALQDSDAIVHFAQDSPTWAVKPGYFMQPWTLMSPAMMGQFPAAALIYRNALVKPGAVLVDLDLNLEDLLSLKGSPLHQAAALDDLRRKDANGHSAGPATTEIDPLVHFAGRVTVDFTDKPGHVNLKNLAPFVQRDAQVVTATHGQLRLDYGQGILQINAPSAQGLSGNLRKAGRVRLADLTIESPLELGHIVAVSLDGAPIVRSKKILLQAMSEEKPAGFQTVAEADGTKRIVSLGTDPWLVREIAGNVAFHRPDAKDLRVSPLDSNGIALEATGRGDGFRLEPKTLYYLLTALNPSQH
ncbi:hypothetical protein SAMN05444166_0577 [Singulisphaera sp. GP187]|uniref:hypothetical protein n=1 Tax=Singulisphaera sp. GP187 TaxID=1882752 RepID=UPI00092B7D91|nr:hypothetical protein [Singulisphaera sp. GP187]SIN74229.1 hypothetical protein SAMN05444166_0577 [Singulisphaera sp. GP187]